MEKVEDGEDDTKEEYKKKEDEYKGIERKVQAGTALFDPTRLPVKLHIATTLRVKEQV